MPYLTYISDTDLCSAVNHVLKAVAKARNSAGTNINKNVIDPFSAIFDVSIEQSSIEAWYTKEKERQVQKSLQNKIDEFHECI